MGSNPAVVILSFHYFLPVCVIYIRSFTRRGLSIVKLLFNLYIYILFFVYSSDLKCHFLLIYCTYYSLFQEPGRVIHSAMQGGSQDGLAMSAYVLITLIENYEGDHIEDQVRFEVLLVDLQAGSGSFGYFGT